MAYWINHVCDISLHYWLDWESVFIGAAVLCHAWCVHMACVACQTTPPQNSQPFIVKCRHLHLDELWRCTILVHRIHSIICIADSSSIVPMCALSIISSSSDNCKPQNNVWMQFFFSVLFICRSHQNSVGQPAVERRPLFVIRCLACLWSHIYLYAFIIQFLFRNGNVTIIILIYIFLYNSIFFLFVSFVRLFLFAFEQIITIIY